MNEQFDLIVLGSGSGARDGANMARKEYGARVALVENTRWGGSCPNVACKPTKAYVVVADLAHEINTLAVKLRVEVAEARANLARIKARKDELITSRDVWIERLRSAGHEQFDGTGRFLDPHTVQVNEGSLSAERILVATGSRTAVPPIEGLDDVDWIDHVTALELTELPESLLVVGGGPVGLELAQIFYRFGSRVVIVQDDDRIAPRSDATATDELHAALEEEGIEIRTGTTISRTRRGSPSKTCSAGMGRGRTTRRCRRRSSPTRSCRRLGSPSRNRASRVMTWKRRSIRSSTYSARPIRARSAASTSSSGIASRGGCSASMSSAGTAATSSRASASQ
jgi:pyruvate/2-oxoglutarate dehydrogenase complex dihydrolipoamide dehydrogenase (E3) component